MYFKTLYFMNLILHAGGGGINNLPFEIDPERSRNSHSSLCE